MPEQDYVWLPRESILSFEEIERLAGIFAGLGAGKLRLTGGEPLLRRGLPDLVRRLASLAGVHDVALTTNGILLGRYAGPLRDAGLARVTLSLDTLRADRYATLTRSNRLHEALRGLEAADRAGFTGTKINTVVMRGVNEDEIVDLIEFGRSRRAEVRFIEYMDVGGATNWSPGAVVSRSEILERVAERFGDVRDVPSHDRAAPADRYVLGDGTTFGVIASVTSPFCRTCDRSRVTADGLWFLCLYAADGIDLKSLLRGQATDDELAEVIRTRWTERSDRGAEERAGQPDRGALYQIEGLRADPHREMHTRGG